MDFICIFLFSVVFGVFFSKIASPIRLRFCKKFITRSIMAQNLNAEIIAIGTEILLGEITDTNSVYIARVLRDIGINLYYMTSVGDNEKRIAAPN